MLGTGIQKMQFVPPFALCSAVLLRPTALTAFVRFCPTCTQGEVCADRRPAKYKHPVNSV